MTKKLNEATAKLDLSGLETSDLASLSEIIRLAGLAEVQNVSDPMSAPMQMDEPSVPELAPMQFDEPEPDVIASPMLDPEAQPEAPSPIGGQVEQDTGGFDVDEIMSLSGIHESVDSDEEIVDNEPTDEEEATPEEIDESKLLPDMFLDETPEELFGPFTSEQAAVFDGESKTNGSENEHFVVTVKGNKFYWKRMVQEDIENRPEPEEFDADGIIHSKHNIDAKKIGRGDNHLLYPLKESDFNGDESIEGSEGEQGDDDEPEDEPVDLDESTESIFESINERFNKFMGE